MSHKIIERLLAGGLLALMVLGCASRQDIITLNDRLVMLEARTGDVQKQVTELKTRLTQLAAQNEAQAAHSQQSQQRVQEAAATMNADVNRLAEELQALRGEVEQGQHQMQGSQQKIGSTVQAELDRTQQAVDANLKTLQGRMAQIENYLNLEHQKGASGSGSPAAAPSDAGTLGSLSAGDLYQSAKSAFDQGDYENARERFQYLLQHHPQSRDADNAQFWIGEIYYREKWYEKAILEYQQVIDKYPKGNKVRASLLKQGFAFYQLNDKANARLILRELIKKYPGTNEAKIAQKKLKEAN